MMACTLHRLTHLSSRSVVSTCLVRALGSSNTLTTSKTRHDASNISTHHFSTTKHDIEDESDIIELAKEEEQDMHRDSDDVEFAEKLKSHRSYRHHNMRHAIDDESDLVELGKEEAQDMVKGVETGRKVHYGNKKFDIEDESDVLEFEKESKGDDSEARTRKQRLSAAAKQAEDGTNYDIEDESDIVEVAKTKCQNMAK